jgi:BCD family chlorophyll transporter-like MFS transporter
VGLGGIIKDVVSSLAVSGRLGEALSDPSLGYQVVYHIEIGLLFITLIALGPLVRRGSTHLSKDKTKLGLAEFPA